MNQNKFFSIIIILLALDSLLKVNFNVFKIHISVLIMAIMGLLIIFTFRKNLQYFFKDNTFLVLFIIYSSSHFFFAIDKLVYIKIVSYTIISFLMYTFIYRYLHLLNWNKIFHAMLIVLILSGIFQYVLYHGFNYQLTFAGLNQEYYQSGGSIAKRMRGFYLEPNWYGIQLFSIYLMLFLEKQKQKSTIPLFLSVLTFLCMYLSGNRGLIILLMYFFTLYFIAKYLKNNIVFNTSTLLSISIILILFTGSIFFFGVDTIQEDRSISARLFSFFNVVSFYFNNGSLSDILFGYGLSNWGAYSNDYLLSPRNYLGDQALTQRDTAEFHVLLFEMGAFAFLLIILDFYKLLKRTNKKNNYIDKSYLAFVAIIYLSTLIYPIYTFLIYMLPFLYARANILRIH